VEKGKALLFENARITTFVFRIRWGKQKFKYLEDDIAGKTW
jgi:hypothetical protein